MTKIEKLMNEGTPFAVIEYYTWLRGFPEEKMRCREIMKLYNCKSGCEVSYLTMTKDDYVFFCKNKDLFKLAILNHDGCVWDCNDFKTFYNEQKKTNRELSKYN